MDDKDLCIDNILSHHEKKSKKRVDGKSKGDRTELNLCKMLSEHFGEEFSRALGSGSRWSQVNNLPEHAKKTLVGDLCVPENFKWVIECKGGYEKDMNLTNTLDGNLSRLDEFIEQVQRDADYCGRLPIVLWKRNRKPWLAMFRKSDLPDLIFSSYIKYNDWMIVNFDYLLNITDRKMWFE